MRRRLVGVALAAALVAGACSRGDGRTLEPPTSTEPTSTTAPADTTPTVVIGDDDPGSTAPQPQVVLSDGVATPLRAGRVPVVEGDPLEQPEIDDAVGRLPEWNVPDDDGADFERPPERLGPPVPGETVETPFPPPVDPPPPVDAPAPGPLQVLRYQPEGEVATAPFLSVTFDQPMVPLTTLDQLADDAEIPVVLTPAVEGRWRWIGTRTLRFEVVPEDGTPDRLPAATEYTATVPAGTTATNGAVLEADVTWTFATPAPTVVDVTGVNDSMPADPVFVATFDQLVDPAAVLPTVTLTADDEPVDVRLAPTAAVDADEEARAAFGAALAGRAVAFTPAAPLPADSAIELQVGPGTPSVEGPRTSTAAHTETGRTFGALRVIEHGCHRENRGCQPGDLMYASFSNPLDTEKLTPERVAELVTVAPAIAGAQVHVYESWVEIVGATTAGTTYTVTFAGDLGDVHGQTLGAPVEVTYTIGSADPALRGFPRDFVTVDPMSDTPSVSFSSINHETVRVIAWAVTAEAIDEFREYLDGTYSDTRPADPDWPVVFDSEIPVEAEADQFTETFVDLSDAFAQSGSQLVVRVEPTVAVDPRSDLWWQNRPSVAWVQHTTLGIDAFTDGQQLVLWTTDLTTGEPVSGVPLELLGDGRVATTDDDGLATVELGDDRILGVFANAGDRIALLVGDWWSGWSRSERPDESRWYVVDDRGVYQPGETVRVAGWVRRLAWAEDAQLGLFGNGTDDTDDAEATGGQHTIDYVVYDGHGVELTRASTATNALGGFNLSVDLPEGANLGQGWVELRVSGPGVGDNNGHLHHFDIQEYRRPEFEVTARAETPPPHFAAEGATVAVDAAYYAGGALPDAEVNWLISTADTTYTPPGWDDFRFGVYTPWWWGPMIDCWDCPGGSSDTTHEEFAGRTDANGTHLLEIAFDDDEGALDLPKSVTAEATVFDVNRQAWADRTDLLVHPATTYVGLRNERGFVEQGTPIRVEAIVTDIDGAVAAGQPVGMTAGRLEWSLVNGTWTQREVDVQTCAFDSADAAHECEFTTEVGGEYRVTAVVTDASGHHNRTEMAVWVAGGTGRPVRGVAEEAITIVPAADEFAPGGTAELLVQAPFAPATGTYTVSHGPIRETHTFVAEDGSAVLQIPIEAADVPTLNLSIEMVGTAPRTNDDGTPAPDAPPRPAFATGQIALPVSTAERTLTVTATPAAEALDPGTDTSVTVAVAGPDGAPVAGADVVLVVVDEAVLALTGYELADPLGVFYQPLNNDVWAAYGRSSVLLTRADLADPVGSTTVPAGAPAPDAEQASSDDAAAPADGDLAGRAAAGAAGQAGQPIEVRENFDAVAVFEPAATTGADGTVTVDVPLPDSLTRYRVMAVAVDGATNFGKGESSITARLPLMARPSAPRFLNFGDTFEFPVVLQNQTDQDLEVLVAIETSNLTLTGPIGKRVVVPAEDRVEVRFPATTELAGTARYRVVAVSADATLGYADAVAGELPVYTPATAEAFATYGVLDGSGDPTAPAAVGQAVIAPTDVFPQFGGLELTTSSTALAALTDAVLYISEYEYQSSDALAGRIMSIATLRDVLEAFAAEGLPSPEVLDRRVADDIAALVRLRNDDGGWAWFVRGRPSDPWLSATATHALVLAQQQGYAVPPSDVDAALEFLAVIEDHIPSTWGAEARTAVRAYALYVRDAAGAGDPVQAVAVYEEAGEALQIDAMAWLWPSIEDAAIRTQIEQTLADRAVDTAGATTFATDYGEDAYLIAHSDRRTDAIVLDALITETPSSDLVAKTVAGLMAGQTQGRWNNIYENAFALVALHKYFTEFETLTPDFVARAWLGPNYVAEHAFTGRTPDRSHTLVPMQELIDTAGEFGATPLVVANDGVGRLYYRLGVRYAPADLVLDPRDEGFVVDRVYEAVDDPADVTRAADGTWHIRSGATVRVRLTMVADAVRTHVALVDPLPAGLEAVNPELDVSQTVPPPPDEGDAPGDDDVFARDWGRPWWSWHEHENLGDDRVEAFASYLPGGTYEYEYIARATTPGEFVVPPTRAEQIYAPEVFGRTASTRVVIADS